MDAANDEVIQFHIDDQGIAILRVNRPEARNALNWEAQRRFADLVSDAASNSAIRVLIVTGSGKRAFISGGDLKELSQNPERAEGERLNQIMTRALDELTELPYPVIAAINGDSFGGGCEVITACDLRIASTRARFSFAHVKNGLTTGWGGGSRLIRLIGQSQAMELLLTARLFDAEEARRLGLVHRVVPENIDLLESAIEWAVRLADLPREAMAGIKALVYAINTISQEEANAFAAAQFVDLWETADHKEALAAFHQKRSPRFNQEHSSDAPE